MADDISALLTWFANYSNYYSIITILLCFSLMVIFIFRLNADHIFPSRIMQFQNPSKHQDMISIENPFHCQLSKSNSSTLNGNVYLQIFQKIPVTIYIVWGAYIQTVYEDFLKDTRIIRKEIQDMTFMKRNSWQIENINRPTSTYNPVNLELTCPSVVKTGNYGQPSRQYYPLVLVMVEAETTPGDTQSQPENQKVEALMTILHLTDSSSTVQSYIIGQYIKLGGRQVFNLQPIFVTASPEREDRDNSDVGDNADNVTEACVVCQTASVSHVILQCRHACVCSNCFLRLDKCPMCRGQIESYFTLTCDDSTDPPEQTDSVTDEFPLSLQSRWEVWNQRLNDFLGIR